MSWCWRQPTLANHSTSAQAVASPAPTDFVVVSYPNPLENFMSFLKTTTLALTLTIAGMSACAPAAHAQSTFADKAVMRLVGKWIKPNTGRSISFVIRDGSPSFQDDIEPGVAL